MTVAPQERRSSVWVIAGTIGLLTFLAFLPALRGEFLNWDDDKLLTENMGFRGFWPENLRWMFSTLMLGNYQPLTWLSYAVDYSIWGMNPFGYRLTNVLLHSANALLVFVLAWQVLRLCLPESDGRARMLGAAIAALFFAVHPLRVESVAWATERKDVLSGCLLLGSVIAYLNYAGKRPAGRGYWASVILMGLSLLAKVWGMTLPIVLLILDVYPLRRIDAASREKRWGEAKLLLSEKLPFILFAGAAAWKSYHAQTTRAGAAGEFGIAHRMAQVCYSIVFYVWKTIVPTGLTPLHARPITLNPYAPRYLICAGIVVIISVGVIALRRRIPALLWAWVIYLVVLAPVSGWVPVGPQIVAERYTYLACIPFAMLLGGAVVLFSRRAVDGTGGGGWSPRVAVVLPATAGLVALAVGTLRYCAVWRDSPSFWQRVVEVEPESWLGHASQGSLNLKAGRLEAARACFERAEQLGPPDALLESNFAMCLYQMGQSELAVTHLRRGAVIPGTRTEVLMVIGDNFQTMGRFSDAGVVYAQVLSIDPNDPDAHTHFGFSLAALGETRAAIEHLERAVALYAAGEASDKTFYTACAKLAEIYERIGDSARATHYREQAVRSSMP